MTETMPKIKADLAEVLQKVCEISDDFNARRTEDRQRQQQMQARLSDLFHITVGYDGKNGLRSRIKAIESKMDILEKWRYQTIAVLAVFQVVVVPVIISFLLKYIK